MQAWFETDASGRQYLVRTGTGVVTAIAPGRTTITAECTDQGETFTANAVIDVTEVNTGTVDAVDEAGDDTDDPSGSSTLEGDNGEADELSGYRMGGGCASQIVSSPAPQGWMLSLLMGLCVSALAAIRSQ